MVGVETLLESMKRERDTNELVLETNELSGSQTHTFQASEDESEVSSIEIEDTDLGLPNEALIMLIRPIAVSGTTDTDLILHESSSRDGVDEVIRINTISSNDSPQTFQPGGGTGVQYLDGDSANQFYFTLTENSGNASVYKIKLRWLSVDP